jgi:hypothetical protein
LENTEENNVSLPSEAKPKTRKKLLILVAVLAILAMIAGAFLTSAFLSAPTNEGGWLFKGAYANYMGSASVMGYSFDFSAKLEVLDFNSTHAYIQTYFKMGSSLGETVENETSTWVELSNFNFISGFSEGNLTKSYEADTNIGTLGTRKCIVYEYNMEGPTMIIYVDKVLNWPVKMQMNMSGEGSLDMSLEINLTDTNIPGLK